MDSFGLAKQLFFEGLSCLQAEQYGQAEEKFRACLERVPDRVPTLVNLAATLVRRGKYDEAGKVCQHVLTLDAHSAEAWLNLGLVAMARSQTDEAAKCFKHAAYIEPANIEAQSWLGTALHRMGRNIEALSAYEQALSHVPDNASLWSDKGALLCVLKRPEEARAACEQALALDSGSAVAWANLGGALHALHCYAEAVDAYDNAIRLQPADAAMWSCLGNALLNAHRCDESLEACERALSLDIDHAPAWSNLGCVLGALGRPVQAQDAFEKALRIQKEYPDARWNLGLVQLQLGNYGEGWKNHESRWARDGSEPCRHGRIPRLENLDEATGWTVLVWSEQGLGDTLQFCRYLPLLAARGVNVIFEVPRLLTNLMTSLYRGTVIAQGDTVPPAHFQIPLMSLPCLFGTRLDSVPADIPYLACDPRHQAFWRHRLGTGMAMRIGLAWSGNPDQFNGCNGSMPLHEMAPLLGLEVQLHGVQKDVPSSDLAYLEAHPQIRSHHAQLDDFAETAALVDEMDLVISVGAPVAHLSGALGKPVWILLPYVADYRWLMDRSDSPWYPNARLFRQVAPGDWASVMQAVVAALQNWSGESGYRD